MNRLNRAVRVPLVVVCLSAVGLATAGVAGADSVDKAYANRATALKDGKAVVKALKAKKASKGLPSRVRISKGKYQGVYAGKAVTLAKATAGVKVDWAVSDKTDFCFLLVKGSGATKGWAQYDFDHAGEPNEGLGPAKSEQPPAKPKSCLD